MPDPNGMAMVLGSTRSWVLTARDGRRAALTGVFSSGDALDAAVWRGDDQAALLAPTVSWVDAAAATVRLTVTAAQLATAGATEGLYRLEVGVTPASDGERRVVHSGVIRLHPTAGTGSALTAYCTSEDLLTYCRELATLQSTDVDQTGFAEQRHRALETFNDWVLDRYRPRPGCSRREVNGDADDAGPFNRFAPASDASEPPTRTQLEAWLTPTRLILNENVIEANARYAASLVYGSTPGANNVYQQMAVIERDKAEMAMKRARVEIDAQSVPDGTPTLRVHRDVTYLT